MPPVINSIIVESMDPEGPFGAKEAGLAGAMNLFQAVGNAIYDAIGVWIKDFPITPDKVLEAMERKKGGLGRTVFRADGTDGHKTLRRALG